MDLNCNVPKQFYNKNNSFIPLSVCASPLLSSSSNNNKNKHNNQEFLQIASSSSINSTGTSGSVESSSGSSSGGFRPTSGIKNGLGGISVGGGCNKRLSAPVAVPAAQCMPLPLMLMDISKQMSASCSAYQQHPWRKICSICKVDVSRHHNNLPMATECEKSVQALVTHLRAPISQSNAAVSQKATTTKTVSPLVSVSDDDSGCGGSSGGNGEHILYEWCPENLTSDQVSAYFSGWPEEKIPFIGSSGAEWRRTQLMTQLPLHDQDIKKCRSLHSADEKREMRMFIAERKRDALGQGCARQIPNTHYAMKCTKCGGELAGGEIAVYGVRAGHAKVWHPGCFQCDVCSELLVDLIYFWKDPHLYCGRHHAHTVKPRCSACDEIIFSDECTEAEGSWWHLDHFCCVECDSQLGGQRYIMHQQQPYCIHCYESIFAQQCSTCNNVIGVDEGQMSYENQHWHATDTCFCCANCSKPLLGLPFLPKRKTLFCSLACNNTYTPPSTSGASSLLVDSQLSSSSSASSQSECAKLSSHAHKTNSLISTCEKSDGGSRHSKTNSSSGLLTIDRLTQNLNLSSTASSSAATSNTSTGSGGTLTHPSNNPTINSNKQDSSLEQFATASQTSSLAMSSGSENDSNVNSNSSSSSSNSSSNNNNTNTLTAASSQGWTKKSSVAHSTASSKQPPLSRNSTTTSPKNFVKPFNYVPPKSTVTSGPDQSAKTTNPGTTGIPQSISGEFQGKEEEDNDSAVSSMTGSNLDTPPVNADIYDPANGEEPPPLPPKPAFMKGHSSPEKVPGMPSIAMTRDPNATEDQLVIRADEHVYSEAAKAAKFQRSLPDLNKKKSNLKIKTIEEEEFVTNCVNSKNVSFNPNVRERTRSSSLPRTNSNDDFGDDSSVVEPEYQFRKSHYKSRSSRCPRRSRRHTASHYYHHHHYKAAPHQFNHEYCSDPEDCTVGAAGASGFSTLPWEYYSDSSSSTSSSSDEDDGAPGFMSSTLQGHPPGSHQFASHAAASHSHRARRHRRSKKSKCKIS